MKDALIVSILSVAPRNRGARLMGWVARSRVSRAITRVFVKVYGLDMSEAEHPISAYPTLEDLFTRRLKAGARPIDDHPDVLVSPVDATVAYVGTTRDGAVPIAEGRSLSVPDLLGSADAAEGPWDVVVLYLSPKDYHRIHVPREGAAEGWRYVPGTLWPVFPASVRRVEGVFSRNERLTVRIRSDRGPIDVVMIGAFGVGRITTEVCDVVTNTDRQPSAATLDPPRPMARGADLGVFHLGSTVVLVTPAGRWQWSTEVGESVRMGRPIATAPRQIATLDNP